MTEAETMAYGFLGGLIIVSVAFYAWDKWIARRAT